MIKSELISSISYKLPHINEEDITLSVNLLLEIICEAIYQGERVELRGFGCFFLQQRPDRLSRNPKTGETLETNMNYLPRFKPGKELRELLMLLQHLPKKKKSN